MRASKYAAKNKQKKKQGGTEETSRRGILPQCLVFLASVIRLLYLGVSFFPLPPPVAFEKLVVVFLLATCSFGEGTCDMCRHRATEGGPSVATRKVAGIWKVVGEQKGKDRLPPRADFGIPRVGRAPNSSSNLHGRGGG